MSRYKVRNWSQYNKSLVNRGSLTLWVSEDALKKWKAPKDRHFIGAPFQYSDDAILCLMMVKMVYGLAYRQLTGLIFSLFQLMGVELPVPHFTTIAERAKGLKHSLRQLSSYRPSDLVFDSSGFKVFGEGEWKVRQHGKGKRRRWKKFHIGICPKTQEVILAEATELEEMDCEMLPKMIRKAPKSVKTIIGDGGYDTFACYKACHERGGVLITPPRDGAVPKENPNPWEEDRNRAIEEIIGLGNGESGKKLWKKLKGYHCRSLVETAFSRFKGIFGSKLFSKLIDNQSIELLIKTLVLNQMTRNGMPKGVMI